MLSRLLVSCTIAITLSSCSGLEVAKEVAKRAIGGPESGLRVDANLGKGEAEGDQSIAQNANTAVSGQVNETTNETFEGPVGTVVNEAGLEIHELLLLVLLAGWAIPGPGEMLRGIVKAVRDPFGYGRPDPTRSQTRR